MPAAALAHLYADTLLNGASYSLYCQPRDATLYRMSNIVLALAGASAVAAAIDVRLYVQNWRQLKQ